MTFEPGDWLFCEFMTSSMYPFYGIYEVSHTNRVTGVIRLTVKYVADSDYTINSTTKEINQANLRGFKFISMPWLVKARLNNRVTVEHYEEMKRIIEANPKRYQVEENAK